MAENAALFFKLRRNMKLILELIIFVLLAIIAWKDIRTMEIPDELNGAIMVCGILAMILERNASMFDRVLGAFCVSLPMYLMIIRIPDSFGGGDVKLTFAMGFYLGWKLTLIGAFFSCLFGGSYACYLLISGQAKAGERAHIPFGPALCLGFLIAKLWGNPIFDWYFGLFC